MSTLSQFGGGQPTRAIVNAHSSGGVAAANVNASTTVNFGREVLSGALTATTLKTLLSVSTGGQCCLLSAYSKNTTSRTIRLVVICDGVTAFDATSSAVAATNSGLIAVGNGTGGSFVPGPPIRWNSSLVVQVASSLTETDNVAIAYSLM